MERHYIPLFLYVGNSKIQVVLMHFSAPPRDALGTALTLSLMFRLSILNLTLGAWGHYGDFCLVQVMLLLE